jgi:hypothetical protein
LEPISALSSENIFNIDGGFFSKLTFDTLMLLYLKKNQAISKAARVLLYYAPIIFYKKAKEIGVLGELLFYYVK